MAAASESNATAGSAVADGPCDICSLFYYSYGVAMILVCVLGIVGNALNMAVLRRRHFVRSGSATYTYLRWLALADLVALATWFPLSYKFMHMWAPETTYAGAAYFTYVGWSLLNIGLTTSSFLCVAVSVDRLLAVYFPTSSRGWPVSRRPGLVSAACAALAVVWQSIPGFFEYIVVEREDPDSGRTVYLSEINLRYYFTDAYNAYVNARNAFCLYLPFVLLAVCSTMTTVRFRQIQRTKKRLAGASGSHEERKEQRREVQLMILLMCVVVVFFVGKVPMAVTFTIMHYQGSLNSFGFELFRAISNNLEAANSAANFYVYCIGSSDFRRQLKLMLGCRVESVDDTTMSGTGASKSKGAAVIAVRSAPGAAD